MAKASPGVLKLPGRFQFLGIPPKGEQEEFTMQAVFLRKFPISRDPPEGGTNKEGLEAHQRPGFQFLGIPPKGELL